MLPGSGWLANRSDTKESREKSLNMLKTLRTRTRKIMLATLILIIPSFVFFYGWSSIRERGNRASTQNAFGRFQPAGSRWVEVTGEEMAYAQWVIQPQIQRQLAIALMQQSGGGMDQRSAVQSADRLIGEVGLNNLATNSDLYTERLDEWALNRYAEEHRIRITEDDVLLELRTMMQGINSPEGRLQRLQQYRLNTNNVSEYLANAERLQRSRLAVRDQARAPLFEMWNLFRQRDEKIKLDYAYLDLDTYRTQVDATPEAVAAYYADHKADFLVGAQRQYSYALLRRDSLEKGLALTEDEYAKYYEDNKDKYRVPRKIQVRHAFFPVDLSKATPEAQKEPTTATFAHAQAAKTMADIAGADFAAIANQLSQDPANTAPDGAKLGGLLPDWFSEGEASFEYGPKFAEAVSKLEEGKVAGPVAVRGSRLTGFSVLKMEKAQDAYVPALAEVRDKVEKDARDAKLDALFDQRLDEVTRKATGFTDIERMAQDLKLETGLTSLVLTTANELSPALGPIDDDDLKYLNDNLQKGQHSDMIKSQNETGQKVAFTLQLSLEKPAHIPDLEEIKDKVAEAYKISHGRELLKTAAQEVLAAATDAAALKAKAEAIKAKFDTTDLFTRVSPPTLPGGEWANFVRDSMAATTGTLAMSAVGPSPDSIQGYAIWRVAGVQTPSREEFQKQVPELRSGLLASKGEAFVNEWLADQRRQLKQDPPKTAREE